ncbi:MAG TPA: hypothetical protein VM146_08610 [Steroidobacteraceae bacterium]|nr:hypothetical protein [Steroidobacteraceae bacterium]
MRTQILGSSSDDRLARGVPGSDPIETAQRRDLDLSESIQGWGSDLDPAMRPGVPRDAAPDIGPENLYIEVTQQQPPHRIHKSTEHAQLTPVFGTACPPRGMSGRLRDAGYKYSEGRLARWLTLMFADRVDMVEGLARDFARLKPPNVVREMGLTSEWRHNRKGVVRAAAVGALVLGAAWLLVRRHRSR